MDYMLGFLGEFISAVELVGKTPTVTIQRVQLEALKKIDDNEEGENAKKKDKWILYFEGKKRGLVLCKTNGECMREMFGRDVSKWVGKRITLHTPNVRLGGKMVPGIRIYGSPDISEPVVFDLKLPRKKPIKTTLLPTGKQQPAQSQQQDDDQPQPETQE